MQCPKCESRLYVLDARSEVAVTYRRLQCRKCGETYITLEQIDLSKETLEEFHDLKRRRLDEYLLKKMREEGTIGNGRNKNHGKEVDRKVRL